MRVTCTITLVHAWFSVHSLMGESVYRGTPRVLLLLSERATGLVQLFLLLSAVQNANIVSTTSRVCCHLERDGKIARGENI